MGKRLLRKLRIFVSHVAACVNDTQKNENRWTRYFQDNERSINISSHFGKFDIVFFALISQVKKESRNIKAIRQFCSKCIRSFISISIALHQLVAAAHK